MAIVSVMYPGKSGSTFDMDYYLSKQMTMVSETWTPAGLRGYQVLRGHPGADGPPPAYQVIVNMDFRSAEAFQAAASQSGAKIMGDVPNFYRSAVDVSGERRGRRPHGVRWRPLTA